ncbi:MAG TPA: hypothetical protein VNH18_14820 [Bryobacteraceae bacterium]|nr:hypothetical protein [Bryobacteraceae bacterium]
MTRVIALGKVAVAAAGTPVNLLAALVAYCATNNIPNPLGPYNAVKRIEVRTHSGNTNKVYVGVTGMVVATKAAVVAELLVPATGFTDEKQIEDPEGETFDMSPFFVDAAVNGEGPLVNLYL